MVTDLTQACSQYVGQAFADPENLSAAGREALERAFFAGAGTALAALPTLSPTLAQKAADFARDADTVADALRQQCAGFSLQHSGRPAPHVPAVPSPVAPADPPADPSPESTDSPAAD